LGTFTITIPLCLNGAAGAELHVPFPVIARSSFGFYFSRFAVVVRMATALFWHGRSQSSPLLNHATTDNIQLFKHIPDRQP
jgi:cytosine/uracil/thiamine/allantoin permease